MILTRIYEKLMGLPHQQHHAARVKQAADELSQDVRNLTRKIERYKEEDDPLAALMIDVFNDRSFGQSSDQQVNGRINNHNGHGEHKKNGPEN